MSWLFFLSIVTGASLIGGWYLWKVKKERILIRKSLDYKLILVTLYKQADAKKDWKQEVAISEQLFWSLAGFKLPIVMEFAVHNVGEDIHLYFAADESDLDALISQIQAFWPGAVVERVEDYNIFSPHGFSYVGYFSQKKEAALPIKTYNDISEDFLLPVMNVFSSLAKEGDGIALQAIFKQASGKFSKQFKKIAEELGKGESLQRAVEKIKQSGLKKIIGFLKETLTPGSGKDKKETELQKTKSTGTNETELIEGINKKISFPLFEVNLRLVTASETQEKAERLINQIAAAAPQLDNPKGNNLVFKRLTGKSEAKATYDFSFRHFREKEKIILNSQELATLVHLPTSSILENTKIKRTRARTALTPLEMPTEGIILGRAVFKDQEKLVRMLPEDRFRHLYVIGQTGTGKTSFLKHLIKQDIEAGEGITFIDPHGNDARDILGLIPKSRWDDVVYFNPADVQYPIGYNLLDYDPRQPEQKTFIANELIEIIGKLYNLAEVGGPMFEQYLKNALFLLFEEDPENKPTLLDVPRVFADRNFRNRLLKRCSDPVVVHFWQKEAEKATGEFGLGNVSTWVLSKLNPFIANDYVRPVIGKQKSTFDIDEIMNNQKILIVNLSKGLIGETNAFFMGMLLTGKIFMVAMARTGKDVKALPPHYLYIDEFQNVTTKTISNILSEARKFKLSLTMAHQYIGQLTDEIRKAVFGNVGTLISFRIGPEDATALKIFFEPIFSEQDLVNIENFSAYSRLMIRGKMSQPFNFTIFPPDRPDAEAREQIIALSRQKYCRPRAEVIEEIKRKYFTPAEEKSEEKYEPRF